MRRAPRDVLIVGGGPAGLSAALVLARCRRSVLVCDAGTPRNRAAREMHAFLTRDGIPPAEFRRAARDELAKYPNVELWDAEVEDAVREEGGFRVRLEDGRTERARKLLLATGVADELPPLEGIEPLWGASVHTCPYCDGWERRGAPIAVYGRRKRGFEMARALTAWTHDLVLCSDGPSGLGPTERAQLEQNGVALVETRIARLEGRDGQLEAIVFRDGSRLRRHALFFDLPVHFQSDLADRLGCERTRSGAIRAGRYEASSVPGVFVAGNILKDVQLAIVAAAEGARAAFGINRSLTREDFEPS
jgi:thioredoxin reductase